MELVTWYLRVSGDIVGAMMQLVGVKCVNKLGKFVPQLAEKGKPPRDSQRKITGSGELTRSESLRG